MHDVLVKCLVKLAQENVGTVYASSEGYGGTGHLQNFLIFCYMYQNVMSWLVCKCVCVCMNKSGKIHMCLILLHKVQKLFI